MHELQKRYLGSFPLSKEDLCCENLLNFKEEYFALVTLVSEVRPLTIFAAEHNRKGEVENLQVVGLGEDDNSEFKIQVGTPLKTILSSFLPMPVRMIQK